MSYKVTTPSDMEQDMIPVLIGQIESKLKSENKNKRSYRLWISETYDDETMIAVAAIYSRAGWSDVKIEKNIGAASTVLTCVTLKR